MLTSPIYRFTLFCTILCSLLILSSCGCDLNCPECHERIDCQCFAEISCQNGGVIREAFCDCDCPIEKGWYGETCSICDQVTCVNGTWNADDCRCDCDSGWEGKACDQPEIPSGPGSFYAFDLSHNGKTISIAANNLSQATLVSTQIGIIYTDDSLDIRLRVKDGTNLLSEQTYPVTIDFQTCEVAGFVDTSILISSHEQLKALSGSVTVDSISSDFTSGTFNAELRDQNGGGNLIFNLTNGSFWIRK